MPRLPEVELFLRRLSLLALIVVAVLVVEGRPSDDEALKAAGIDRARAVLACVDSDAENIFITLSARELREDITIVARASVEDSEKKLRRAGADRVISPYKASGRRSDAAGGPARGRRGRRGRRARRGRRQRRRAGAHARARAQAGVRGLLHQRRHAAGPGAGRAAAR